ncbi:MAG: ABC transporter substrate-binding protein [Sporichthyaceae bacterium]
MSNSAIARGRARTWRTAAVGAVVLALTLSACGGTRVSDEAIQAAAGVGAGAQAAGAPVGVAAAPTTTDAVAAPDATTTDTATSDASAPAPAAGTAAAAPVAGTAKSTKAAATTGAAKATKTTGGVKQPAAATKANAAAAPAAAAAAGPASKSVIKLGAVGTFSGPVGGLVKDTITGIRAWGQAVNASGGVNGHPVQILVGDDGGDPARFNSILQQFVEKEGVIALLYTTLGFAPNGNNKYLDSKKIFTFSTEGGLETSYGNPYVLTATPAGLTNADSMMLSFGKGVGAAGKNMKIATFACSDFGLCDNFDKRWSTPEVLKTAGFQQVVRGRPSLTQPDYTTQCLAAKQAGAEAILMALDGAAIRRLAGDCARQNYRPKLGTADLVVTGDLPGDKNVDGLFIGTKMAPFSDTRIQGVKEAHAAFGRFAPGQKITGGMTNGWIIGEFFAQAGKNLPDKPTPADVADGIYAIENNNLKGMTYPITMTKGQPVARQLCYGVAVIEGDGFGVAPGPSLYCEKKGQKLNSLSDYTVAPAAALPASFGGGRMLPMLAPRRIEAPAAPASSCGPARAAGFSYFLDAFQTGTAAGPGVFYGAALAALGVPLPDPLGSAQRDFLKQGGDAVVTFSKDTPAAIAESRQYFEPFAVYNDYGNAFIETFANSLDAGADTFGPFVQPGDRSMREVASSARDAKVEKSTCAPTVDPAVANTPAGKLGLALAGTDRDAAVALLKSLRPDAKTLGEAVFIGGIAAANANRGQEFSDTVAFAFPAAGVAVGDAGAAFQAAATKAASDGLTFEQGAIGFRTVTQTFAAYAAKGGA